MNREIVAWLAPPPGGRVLDAGCGTAGFSELIAEALGREGRVDAIDRSAHLLAFDRDRLAGSPGGSRIRFHQSTIEELPFEDGAFDVAWCSRAVHHLADRLAGVRELTRVLRSGGRLAIREGGMSARFLPSEMEAPGRGRVVGLNERLAEAMERWFYEHTHHDGERVPYSFGWTQMLRDAGLRDVSARTFVYEFLPPFSELQSEFLLSGLERWVEDEERHEYLSADDRETLARLIDAGGPGYVFDRPDLHFLEGITVYAGRK